MLYYFITIIINKWNNITVSDSVHSWTNIFLLDIKRIVRGIKLAYTDYFSTIFVYKGDLLPYSLVLINILLFLIAVYSLASVVRKFKNKYFGALIFLLLVLMPAGTYIACILNARTMGEITEFAIWMYYILIYITTSRLYISSKLNSRYKLTDVSRYASIILLFIFILNNIRVANVVYVKKNLEREATLSVMTNIVDRIEEIEGVSSSTPIAFCGNLETLLITPEGLEDYELLQGVTHNSTINVFFSDYVSYYLYRDYNILDESIALEYCSKEEVTQMPVYPNNGSIKVVDGVLIVKLSN